MDAARMARLTTLTTPETYDAIRRGKPVTLAGQ